MSQQDTSSQQTGVPTTPDSQEFGSITSSATQVDKEELDVADSDGALAQETGSTGKSSREIAEDAIHEYLADLIYSSNEAFPREYNQNAETAVIRAAKLLLTHHPEYGEEWLTRTVLTDSGRTIELPRPLNEVMDAARTVGYDPTIEVSVYHDDRQIVYEDPGIGMTAHELDKAFNVTGKSGVSYDADTGGKMGVGALSYVNASGMEGDMSGMTVTRKPDAKPIDKQGISFLTDLHGLEEVPNDVPDDFHGTRFEIPVLEDDDGGFNLHNFQDWVAKYGKGLRVPLLYKEYRNGETIVEEEYGGQTLEEMHNDPPIVVDRPGEYTIIAGPQVDGGRGTDDCYLVSMPIDKNTRVHNSTLWNVVVQIHNEQGLIVEGPNRGMTEDEVDSLHPEDVPLPQPTADRDRLQRDTANKRFFNHVGKVVKDRELEVAAQFLEEIDGPEDVLEAPQNHEGKWQTFRKVLRRHGPHGVKNNLKRFVRFLQEDDNEFRTYDEDGLTISEWEYRGQCVRTYTDDDATEVIGNYDINDTYQQLHGLFKEFSHAPESGYNVSRKSNRSDKKLGNMLAGSSGSNIFMAASTGGKFTDRAKVVWNTLDDAEVVVVDGVRKYSTYEDLYGFRKLKEVPCRPSDDEDNEWDIPSDVVRRNKRTKGEKKTNSGKPDDVGDHVLKLRTENSNKIDYRTSIESLRSRFSDGGKGLDNHDDLILFPRSAEENISDNYKFADHAAIASCTNEEYDALEDLDSVWLHEDFKADSYRTELATPEGDKSIGQLLNDDRMVIIASVDDDEQREVITDDESELREYFEDDLSDQLYKVDDDTEILWAVCDGETAEQIDYAVDDGNPLKWEMAEFMYGTSHGLSLRSYNLKQSMDYYERLMATPNWDDDSDVYKVLDSFSFNKGYSSHMEEILLALHDLDIDPTKVDEDEVRTTVRTVYSAFDGDERACEKVDPDDYSWDGN